MLLQSTVFGTIRRYVMFYRETIVIVEFLRSWNQTQERPFDPTAFKKCQSDCKMSPQCTLTATVSIRCHLLHATKSKVGGCAEFETDQSLHGSQFNLRCVALCCYAMARLSMAITTISLNNTIIAPSPSSSR